MAKTATKPQAKQGGKKDYDETNRGVLFVNDKDGNEKRPDYTGKILVNAADFEEDEQGRLFIRLAGWLNESDKVGSYISLLGSSPQKK